MYIYFIVQNVDLIENSIQFANNEIKYISR